MSYCYQRCPFLIVERTDQVIFPPCIPEVYIEILGGKVFTIEREKNKKETDLEKKKKIHMKERRKGGRNAEGLLRKQRPSGYQKGFKK